MLLKKHVRVQRFTGSNYNSAAKPLYFDFAAVVYIFDGQDVKAERND